MWGFNTNQELNPCPLQWKHRVLISGPPGKCPPPYFYLCSSVSAALELLALPGVSLVEESGVHSSLKCVGFSLQWLL